jgi:hypothetical protein
MCDPMDTHAEPVDEALQLRAIFCLPGSGFDPLHNFYLFREEKGSQSVFFSESKVFLSSFS